MVPWFSTNFPAQTEAIISAIGAAGEQIAAVILARQPVTVEQLKTDYVNATIPGSKKVRVLVVPGHEPYFGGTEYGVLKERDLNVDVANEVVAHLSRNPRYEVFITRNKQAWLPEFSNYFKVNWDEIIAWQKANKDAVKKLVEVGGHMPVQPAVYHNTVDAGVGVRLHGINKWANENDIDIAIHVHFNDYPRSNTGTPGRYTGFAIYVPEPQFYNSVSAKALANTVFKRLSKYNPVSNLRGEREGIIDEPDLIAIGSYNSLDAASILIEYGYIYEPQLNNPKVRDLFLKEIAYETYLGIMDFFEPAEAAAEARVFDTLMLPHTWGTPLTGDNDLPSDVFALQTALILDGVYPPEGLTRNDCPRTGKIGPCTRSALQAFQNKYSITGEKGIAGPKTLQTLNKIYSGGTI